MQDRVFYSSCFGLALGVLLRSFISIDLFGVILIALISTALFFFFLIYKNNWGIIASIFLVALSFGVLRFHLVDKPTPQIFEVKVDHEAEFIGNIVDEPDKRENSQKLTIEIEESEEKTKVLVTVSYGGNLKYGDRVKISGKLKKPENFVTDQGKDFDYINYLRKDGIMYVMSFADVELISSGNGNFIKSSLFLIKHKFLEKISTEIPSPESLLMSGLILGEKSAFSADLRQSFIDTGTIHIVALSGYNVTIVAEWIMKVFSFLPQNLGIGVGILSILLFVVMSGGSSTAVRAGIMAVLVLIARLTGRTYDVARALVLAGISMILLNPFVLAYDVSFQLSFIATVAVIFFTPKLEKYFLWVTPRLGLRDVVTVTSAAYIFVLPFILYKMGNLSLVALPANVLILPFIPLTMLFGFLTGFLSLIWYVFAVPVSYVSYFLLHYELSVVGFFARLPFASFSVPHFSIILTLLIYAYFIYMLFGRSIKSFFQFDTTLS